MSLAIGYNISQGGHNAMKVSLQSSDEALVQGCVKGHRLAQKYLYQRYYGRMMGICMRYTRDRETATEVLNMAFLKVFKSIDKYQATGPLAGWIARIVFRTNIDYIRSNAKYKKAMDFDSEADNTVLNEAMSNLAVEEIFTLIQKLPPASRAVFNLYVIEGYKHQEIAQQLEISEGTSKWHLNNARKQLQHFLIQLK